jgi:DNA polymerase III alpha subunit
MSEKKEEQFAIRFGLGAIKAVGFNIMEKAVEKRHEGGDFKDIYDFTSRLDPKSINKKSIEALAKAGAFDPITDNRRQIAESFDILSSYANQTQEEALSNQMHLFGSIADSKPALVKVENWPKAERLTKEFEAFGFFLNEHPVDDVLSDLKKRGVIFSDKIERDELKDGNLVKFGGVVAGSKHRSSARGRFAYLSVSDPFGIFESMIFDEAIITNARDILVDGSAIILECLIKKDDGGLRILVRDVQKLSDFIRDTKPAAKEFEDIKQKSMRKRKWNPDNNSGGGFSNNSNNNFGNNSEPRFEPPPVLLKESLEKVIISLTGRDTIFRLKAFLAGNPAPVAEGVLITKVFLKIDEKLLELGGNYYLDANDVTKLEKINGVSISS